MRKAESVFWSTWQEFERAYAAYLQEEDGISNFVLVVARSEIEQEAQRALQNSLGEGLKNARRTHVGASSMREPRERH